MRIWHKLTKNFFSFSPIKQSSSLTVISILNTFLNCLSACRGFLFSYILNDWRLRAQNGIIVNIVLAANGIKNNK